MRLGAAAAITPKELEDRRFQAMIDNDFDTLDQLLATTSLRSA